MGILIYSLPRAWGGLAYLYATRTLTITEDTILGPISIDISQQPRNPWNAAVGGSVSINDRWELLVEYGSNFDDATLVILAASVRFF